MQKESALHRNLNAANGKESSLKMSSIEHDIAQLRRVANVEEIDTQHSLTDSFRRPPPAYWAAVADLQTVDKLGFHYSDAVPATLAASDRDDPLGKVDSLKRVAVQHEHDACIMHGESLPPSHTNSPLNAYSQRKHTDSNASAAQDVRMNIEFNRNDSPRSSTSTTASSTAHYCEAPPSVAHSTCAPTTVDYNYSRQSSSAISQLSSPQSTVSTKTLLDGLFGCLRPMWNKLSWNKQLRTPTIASRNNLDRVCKLGAANGSHLQQGELTVEDLMALGNVNVSQSVDSTGNYAYVLTDADGVRYTVHDGTESHPHWAGCSACVETDWLIKFDELSELKFFAAGAQGAVFRGEFRGRPVAFKKVRNAQDAENMRFLRSLSHPNVIEVLGVVLEPSPAGSNVPSCFGIVMDFCEFGSLYNLLHDGRPVQPSTCLRWLMEIANGMTFLHTHRIIHRDLKTPNVLIAADETVKISDFGASRTWSAASTKLSFAGTAAWVAPEVIRNEKSSDAVDVWSYGIVVWEVLTGEVPYRDLDQPAIIYGVGSRRLSLPLPTDVPNGLRMLISTCCNDSPRARPTFRQVAERLTVIGHELANLSVQQFENAKTRWREEIKQELAARYARNGNDRRDTDRKLERELIDKREAELQHATELKQLYEAKLKRGTHLYDELCRLVDDHEKELGRLRQLQAHYLVSASAAAALTLPHGRQNSMRKPRFGSSRQRLAVPDPASVSADPSLYDFANASSPSRSELHKRSASSHFRVDAPPVNNSPADCYVTLPRSTPSSKSCGQLSAASQTADTVPHSQSDTCANCADGPGSQCVMCSMAQLIEKLHNSATDSNSADTAIIRKLTELCAMPHSHSALSHTQSAFNVAATDVSQLVDANAVVNLRTHSFSSGNVRPLAQTQLPVNTDQHNDSLTSASSNFTLSVKQTVSQNDLNAASSSQLSNPDSDLSHVVASVSAQNVNVVQLRRSNRRVIVTENDRSGNSVVLSQEQLSQSPCDDSHSATRNSVYSGCLDDSLRDSRVSYGTNSECEDGLCRRDSHLSNGHADVEDNADAEPEEQALSDEDIDVEVDSVSLDELDDAEAPCACEHDAECDCTADENMTRGVLRTSGRSCASVVTVVHVSSASQSDKSKPSSSFSRQSSGKSGLRVSAGKGKVTVPHSLTLDSDDKTGVLTKCRVPPSTSRDSAIVMGLTPSTPTAGEFGQTGSICTPSSSSSQAEQPAVAQVGSSDAANSMALSVIDEMLSSTASASASASNDSRPVSALSDSSECVSVSGRVGQADRLARELERQVSDCLSDREFVVQSLSDRLREHSDALAATRDHVLYNSMGLPAPHGQNVRRTAALSSCSSEAMSSSDECDGVQFGASGHSRHLPISNAETLV